MVSGLDITTSYLESQVNENKNLQDLLTQRSVKIKNLNDSYSQLGNELEFYMVKVDSLTSELLTQKANLDQTQTEINGLSDSLKIKDTEIIDLNLRLSFAESLVLGYRRREQESKPKVIKLPGDINARFTYYFDGNSGGGLTLSRPFFKNEVLNASVEGGFNIFEGRDTGQFIGARLGLNLTDRFGLDFSLGPYILREFDDGAKATLKAYFTPGVYIEPIKSIEGFGFHFGARKIGKKTDYSLAIGVGTP